MSLNREPFDIEKLSETVYTDDTPVAVLKSYGSDPISSKALVVNYGHTYRNNELVIILDTRPVPGYLPSGSIWIAVDKVLGYVLFKGKYHFASTKSFTQTIQRQTCKTIEIQIHQEVSETDLDVDIVAARLLDKDDPRCSVVFTVCTDKVIRPLLSGMIRKYPEQLYPKPLGTGK